MGTGSKVNTRDQLLNSFSSLPQDEKDRVLIGLICLTSYHDWGITHHYSIGEAFKPGDMDFAEEWMRLEEECAGRELQT